METNTDKETRRTTALEQVHRVKVVRTGFIFVFIFCLLHLLSIQVLHSTKTIGKVKNAIGTIYGQEKLVEETAPRGMILDRLGRPFTTQQVVRRVSATPQNFTPTNEIQILRILNKHFPAIPVDPGILKRPVPNSDGSQLEYLKYMLISKDCPRDVWDAFMYDLDMQKKGFRNSLSSMFNERLEYRQNYIEGDMLCHVLGWTGPNHSIYFLDKDGRVSQSDPNASGDGSTAKIPVGAVSVRSDRGIAGLESLLDENLRPAMGYRTATFNRTRHFRTHQLPPVPGTHVVLTIDKYIQNEAEKILLEIVEKWSPVSASIIVTHPATGEIIAVAGAPGFNPSQLSSANWGFEPQPEMDQRVTRTIAFSDHFEPGSTVKPLLVAAALEAGRLAPDEELFCPASYPPDMSKPIHESTRGSSIGQVHWSEIIFRSSNVGTAKIVMEKLGFDLAYEHLKILGFGSRTSAHLYREVPGNIRAKSRDYHWIDHPRVAIGQSFDATGIQMMMAFGCLANGGNLLEAQIVKYFVDPETPDKVFNYVPMLKRAHIYSNATCRMMIDAMRKVVDDPRGTGRRTAYMDHHTVAGKTGTAQVTPHRGQEELYDGRRAYTGSFIGFFPASEPTDPVELKKIRDQRFCVGVWVHGPVVHGGSSDYYGGNLAGPYFKAMSEIVADYYRIPEDKPSTPRLSQNR